MKVLVIGGSNSILRDGYIYHFEQKLRSEFEEVSILNFSAGGTTSLTPLALLGSTKFEPDLVIIEYSLNDAGHINHLEQAYQKKYRILGLCFKYIEASFPGAIIVPLILASEPFYDTGVKNHVYEAELDFFKVHGVRYHDMRAELFAMFGATPPYFLYSDQSHFHRGFASALIGRTLAEKASMIVSLQRIMKPRQGIVYHPEETLNILRADELSALMGLNIGEISNRHVRASFVEIKEKETLDLDVEGWPVCIYFASDNKHCDITMEVAGVKYQLATVHDDCRGEKFIITSVPLILNDAFMASKPAGFGRTALKFSLSEGDVKWSFDCLQSRVVSEATRVRIVGIAVLEPGKSSKLFEQSTMASAAEI